MLLAQGPPTPLTMLPEGSPHLLLAPSTNTDVPTQGGGGVQSPSSQTWSTADARRRLWSL